MTTATPDNVVFLDLLGPERDSEKGTTCPGELPPASDPELVERATAARAALGDRAFILGHHYQRDEVIQFADARGDSFRLAQQAAARPEAEFIVFCGVHFMAESADILTSEDQRVVLPDLAAGCSMADMATAAQVEEAWEVLEDWVPGGAARAGARRLRGLGSPPGRGRPRPRAGAPPVILWRGHCSVHNRFMPEHVDLVRERIPGVSVIVHPECRHEVVEKADLVGSTERIVAVLDAAPAGSKWAVGTELNLVHRLAAEHPDKTVAFLDRTVCFCSTMNRIDLPHLVWSLEELLAGRVPNRIEVDARTRAGALLALERMLALPAA